MGAFIWQLGCLSPEMHGVTLGVTSFLFSCIFVCVPYISGQLTLEFLTLPLLSALMLVVGSADLVPGVNALNLESLLSAETAAASAHAFKIWSLVWILALGIQCFLARIQLRLVSRRMARTVLGMAAKRLVVALLLHFCLLV